MSWQSFILSFILLYWPYFFYVWKGFYERFHYIYACVCVCVCVCDYRKRRLKCLAIGHNTFNLWISISCVHLHCFCLVDFIAIQHKSIHLRDIWSMQLWILLTLVPVDLMKNNETTAVATCFRHCPRRCPFICSTLDEHKAMRMRECKHQ